MSILCHIRVAMSVSVHHRWVEEFTMTGDRVIEVTPLSKPPTPKGGCSPPAPSFLMKKAPYDWQGNDSMPAHPLPT